MMKTLHIFCAIFLATGCYAQIPTYYNGVDFSKTGMDLKTILADKITDTHTNQISYSQVWDVLRQSDLDPTNANDVLLVYGYDDTDVDLTNDRTRDKDDDASGSPVSGEWNREHVYPKGLGSPNLGTSGPGSDAHNLKPSDIDFNNERANKKFTSGSLNGGTVGANWYPGDEWKGDVARIYMYMYLRYDAQCKPVNACTGTPITIDTDMVDLLLQWNIEDPVSAYESNRNDIIFNTQNNRNPFIDNAYLATVIWGGGDALNTWTELGLEDEVPFELSIYPNPTYNGTVFLTFNDFTQINTIDVFDISGKIIQSSTQANITADKYKIDNLNHGVYFVKISTYSGVLTKKIVVK